MIAINIQVRCVSHVCLCRAALQVLTLFAAADVFTPDSRVRLLDAANRYMLPLFLLANLLTGAVNLGVDTLAVGDWRARGIVAAYTLVLCCAASAAPARRHTK